MREKLRKFEYNYNQYKNDLIIRTKCPCCSSYKEKKIWVIFNKYFKAVNCTICNFIYIDKILNEAGLKSYYNNYIEFRLKNKTKLIQRKKMYEIDLKYLSLYKKNGRLIDIGCSNGDFLKILHKKYDSFGIDIDSEAIDIAKKNKSISKNVFNFRLTDIKNKLGKFDIAVLRGVIEHVKNPIEYFAQISKLLRKNGIIFISATPNVDSPCAIKFKDKWNQFDPIQHINLFSADTIKKIGNKYGFKLIGQHYPYLETPYANFENNLKNFISKKTRVSPPFWGSMMTLILKKI
jgi:2-polyprenyl-3-methyl-5-hydroxy-6-metoxy-1,4-benzoquinol methylase